MRLVIVSNRLPFTIIERDGVLTHAPSPGGVATGLGAYLASPQEGKAFEESLWVGWPGWSGDEKRFADVQKLAQQFGAAPVFISEAAMDSFYYGFCNKTIWPLFHCFSTYTTYEESFWKSYRAVNETFCEALAKVLRPDDSVWVHDYQLMLLPGLLRKRVENLSIGFFLHIPFPPREIYQLLPRRWRTEILEGMLGADLVGFHTNDYTQNFLQCVLRFLGHDHTMGMMVAGDRPVKVDTFPMGIDVRKYHDATLSEGAVKAQSELRQSLGQYRLILSVDRLDYTKGILNRLEGFEQFLEQTPQWHKQVVLVLIVVPSRVAVDDYQLMKQRIDETVGRINGKYAVVGWTPIHYQYAALDLGHLASLYHACDVALVTPLRDGMNLVAKEYVASRTDGTGVLILSEMAGASKELGEAILINPNYREEMAHAIAEALAMPVDEQRSRIQVMQERLREYDVFQWASDFIRQQSLTSAARGRYRARELNAAARKQIVDSFKGATSRIVFTDYDGTLVPFAGLPKLAKPDSSLMELLARLAAHPQTTVVLVSGRDKATLEEWLGTLPVILVAEHGAWVREMDGKWQLLKRPDPSWRENVLAMMQRHVARLPGSFIENKEFSTVWHYRGADSDLAKVRAGELMDELISFTANADVQVLQGSKVVEIREGGVSKGRAAAQVLGQHPCEFVLAAGDDWTDEDLFKAMPEHGYTIKVGALPSQARYFVRQYRDARKLLEELVL